MDEDAKMFRAAELDHCLHLPNSLASVQAWQVLHQILVLLRNSTHRGARTHDHKVKSLALYRLS